MNSSYFDLKREMYDQLPLNNLLSKFDLTLFANTLNLIEKVLIKNNNNSELVTFKFEIYITTFNNLELK